jgi:hypothetical protein
MLKKYLVLSLIVLLFNFTCGGRVFAQTQDDKAAKKIEKIRAKVAKYGTDKKHKVLVTLLNQTKVKGYISAIGNDSFTVTDKKTGSSTEIAFTDVKKVGSPGLSTPAKIGIILAITVPAAVLLTIFGIIYCNEQAC